MKIHGKFEVTLNPLNFDAQGMDGTNLARMSIDKKFKGEAAAFGSGRRIAPNQEP